MNRTPDEEPVHFLLDGGVHAGKLRKSTTGGHFWSRGK
jgi:hypothetical protein